MVTYCITIFSTQYTKVKGWSIPLSGMWPHFIWLNIDYVSFKVIIAENLVPNPTIQQYGVIVADFPFGVLKTHSEVFRFFPIDMRTTTGCRAEYSGCLFPRGYTASSVIARPPGHHRSPSGRLHMAISHGMTRYIEASIAPPHRWLAALIKTRQNPMPPRVAHSLIPDPKHAQNLQCAYDVRIISSCISCGDFGRGDV